jgi:hypothetical protein
MNLTTLVTELRDTATKISDYLADISVYLANKTGTPPGIEEIVPTVSTDAAQEAAQQVAFGSNSFSSGTISAALYENQAFIREAQMASTFKFQFYDTEASELSTQAESVQSEVAKKINYIQGRSPEQNMTL